jgi:pimeloyl-ACP methyl ester carboxylesterase
LKNPVIVLPGYYGTFLEDSVSLQKVWLTVPSILHSGETLDAIRLDTGDPDRIVSGKILDEIEIVGRWSPNVYKGLLLFLGSIGYSAGEVVGFGVDWRRTVDFTVDKLQQKILGLLRQTGAPKVDIIAHSHGGLVARAYMRRYTGERIDNFITVGTPHKGMVETFKALCEGVPFFGFSPSHLSKVARSFPSAYELLPLDPADGFFTWDGKADDPFAETGWATDGISLTALAQAATCMQGLAREIPAKTTLIVGTHIPTFSVAQGTSSPVRLTFPVTESGDGTVPSVSAAATGLTSSLSLARFNIPYGVHSHLFEYAPAQRIIKNALLNRPMPHTAFGFAANPYTPGKSLGVAVDVRTPSGDVPSDAVVTITLEGAGKATHPLTPGAEGDFFARLPMPSEPVHLQYRIDVSAPSLGVSSDPVVGMLWAANHD